MAVGTNVKMQLSPAKKFAMMISTMIVTDTQTRVVEKTVLIQMAAETYLLKALPLKTLLQLLITAMTIIPIDFLKNIVIQMIT